MRTLVDFVLGGVARQSRPTQDAADEEAEGCTSPNASNSRLRNGWSVASNQTGAMTIEPHSTPGWMHPSHTSWLTGGWNTVGPRLAGWLRCGRCPPPVIYRCAVNCGYGSRWIARASGRDRVCTEGVI